MSVITIWSKNCRRRAIIAAAVPTPPLPTTSTRIVHLPSLLVNEPLSPPPRDPVQVRRLPELAVPDRQDVVALLDRSSLCHVGLVTDGQPFVIPTLYARVGDELLLHGSVASRLVRHVRTGEPICVTVTEVDGLVLARSAFETSMNYRSVVVLGTGREVTERRRAPGRAACDQRVRAARPLGRRAPARRHRAAADDGRGGGDRAVLGQGVRRPSRGPRARVGPAGVGRAGCRCDVPPARPSPRPTCATGSRSPTTCGPGSTTTAEHHRVDHDRESSRRNHEPTTGSHAFRWPCSGMDRCVSSANAGSSCPHNAPGHAPTHPRVERHAGAVAAGRVPEPVDLTAVRQAVQRQRHPAAPDPIDLGADQLRVHGQHRLVQEVPRLGQRHLAEALASAEQQAAVGAVPPVPQQVAVVEGHAARRQHRRRDRRGPAARSR